MSETSLFGPEHWERMHKGIPAVVHAVDELFDGYGIEPRADSLATREAQHESFGENARDAHCRGLMSYVSTRDHLAAFLDLVGPPARTLAPATCVRGLLETAAIGSWLLTPTIEVRERIGRNFAMRYEGFRPYASKANILPEQTIGRGLRLMFRGALKSGYVERVDVIGNKGFMEFVDQLDRDEDLNLETFDPDKDKLRIVTIEPDLEKIEKDILVPDLSPILARKRTLADEIAAIELPTVARTLPKRYTDQELQSFIYEGFDLVTREKLFSKEYTIPEAQTAGEVISYYAKRIAQDLKLPSQFAALAPRVREFLETRAFGETVDLESPDMIKAISNNVCQHVTLTTFAALLRGLVVEQLEPMLVSEGRALSSTPAYPFTRPTFESEKTIFNLVAPDNGFELAFAKFAHECEDVDAFAKLPKRFGFTIAYTDTATNLRYYEPDFVVRLTDGSHILVETKGMEDIDVAHKDRAAQNWTENATLLTGVVWSYLKVPEKGFKAMQPILFDDLWHL